MLFANPLLIFSSIVAFLLALLILVANSKRSLNRVSFIFNLNIFFWLLFNLLANLASNASSSLIFAKLVFIPASLIPLTFLIFVKTYIKEPLSKNQIILYSVLPFILILTTPTELNIVSIKPYGVDTVLGLAYLPLLVMYGAYFFRGLNSLRHRFKDKKNTTASERQQIKYIFIGVLLTLVPGLIANIILPIAGFKNAVFYGPIFSVFLALFTTLAIVKHRFLDIRLVVARSIAYILSVVAIGLVFSLVAFGIVGTLFGSGRIASYRGLIYIILALVLATTFQSVRSFFDRITNTLFYRDAYDPQQLFNDLNSLLVSSIDLNVVLNKSAEIIYGHLKSEYVIFSIIEKGKDEPRVESIGTTMDKNIAKNILQNSSKIHEKMAIVDELVETDPAQSRILLDNNVSIAVKLVSTAQHGGSVGYLLFGAKKSGNLYNSQDIKVIEILADELVIAIQNALRFEEIQQFNVTLQGKVDEATKQLRSANEKLKALDETKDEFISMASHQLRTPLTTVKGYLSMVLEGDAGKVPKNQQKLLDQSFVSAQRMVYLIADLLNVSRLRTGKFVIDNTPTNLADVVEGEIDQLIKSAKDKDLELTYKKPTNFPTLMLDETKIRQVIMNFADNAIYYTPAGGHIQVNLVETPQSVELTVVDDGIGVPKSEQHHMFTKFYRAGNAKKARPDGTGLGLFMAKKVVIAQGGAIIFKTEEGKGSTFGFSFSKDKLKVPSHVKADPKSAGKKEPSLK